MTKHVHYDMIVEWAKDPSRVVQYRKAAPEEWRDVREFPSPQWHSVFEYRFKPKPHIVQHLFVAPNVQTHGFDSNGNGKQNLRLTFSGEDGRLLKAEVLE